MLTYLLTYLVIKYSSICSQHLLR